MKTYNTLIKKCVCLSALIFFTFASWNLQGQAWQWAAKGGATDALGDNTQREEVSSMYTAANGDTYVSSAIGRIDLQIDGHPKTTYSTAGLNDIVIAGFSCDGNYKWSKVLGSYYGAIAAQLGGDANGNVYAACRINSTRPTVSPPRQFDSDVTLPSSALNVNTYKQTLFLIKYDSNGNYLWYRTPQADDVDNDTGNQINPIDIEVDAAGNSYMVCLLSASSYGGGQYVTTQRGIHIIKYDTDGNFTGAFPLELTATTYGRFKMKRNPNNGNIYIGGENASTSGLQIGGQPVMGSKYVAAFDCAGHLLWERENISNQSLGESGVSFDVTVDSDGNVYFIGATGYLPSSNIPDSFNGIQFANPNGTSPWPFIVKLDAQGNTLWQTNGRQSTLRSVAVNGNEVAVASGARDLTWQNLTFLDPASGGRPFIARFDKSDGHIIAINALQTNSDDRGTVLTADAHGNYYLGGRFGSNLTAGPETITSSGGTSDFFVAKFGQSNCNLATEVFDADSVKVYPNPVADKFFVNGADHQRYEIYDMLGHKVQSGVIDSSAGIDISGLATGLYYLNIISSMQRNTVVKLSKV